MLPLDTIRCADLFDLCASLPDKSIDMVMCDLPYGTTACSWDTVIPFEPMWAAFRRVIKPRGAIVLTASQPFTSRLVCSALDMFKYQWVWNKQLGSNHLNAPYQPLKTHEDVCVFSMSASTYSDSVMCYYPQMQSGKPYIKSNTDGVKKFLFRSPIKTGMSINSSGDRYPASIISIDNAYQSAKIHPTQKPVALFEYLIRTYTQPGDVVLDPCVGSGTTAVAARKTDRRYICGDSSPEYVAVAQQRLQNSDPYLPKLLPDGTKQLSLFEVAS